MRSKLPILLATLAIIVPLDVATKRWALGALEYGRTVHVLDGLMPLTLAFNRGAAFSLHVGDASRWVFLALSLVALAVLTSLLHRSEPGDTLRISSISLVAGGAIGNLIDRVRWSEGVVDFLGPIDLGFMLWPIFNVADMAITTGASLLAVSLWQEARRDAAMAHAVHAPAGEALPDDA